MYSIADLLYKPKHCQLTHRNMSNKGPWKEGIPVIEGGQLPE